MYYQAVSAQNAGNSPLYYNTLRLVKIDPNANLPFTVGMSNLRQRFF